MNLKYLNYLNCFCGAGQFTAYSIENDSIIAISTNNIKIIENGLLICNTCGRNYSIIESMLTMLPEALFDEDSEAFLNKYAGALRSNTRKKMAPLTVKTEKTEGKEVVFKRNEMKARDNQAEVYHTFGYPFYTLNEQRVFKKFLNISNSDVVVELGCGTGKITREVIQEGFSDLIALDFSGKSIRILQNQLTREMKDRILFIKADVCNLPLKGKFADKVISAQVFEHLPGSSEQLKYINELQRILKSDGLAALTIYNFNIRKRIKEYKKGFHDGAIYFENFTKKEIKKMFKPYFVIKKMCGINCYFPFAPKFHMQIQNAIEAVLSKTFFNSALGNILFLGLTQNKKD